MPFLTHLLLPLFNGFGRRKTSTRIEVRRPAPTMPAGIPAGRHAIPAGPASATTVTRPRTADRHIRLPLQPLRVVRILEIGAKAPHGGRMRISGRMADVCAELDRLAEREAALAAGI